MRHVGVQRVGKLQRGHGPTPFPRPVVRAMRVDRDARPPGRPYNPVDGQQASSPTLRIRGRCPPRAGPRTFWQTPAAPGGTQSILATRAAFFAGVTLLWLEGDATSFPLQTRRPVPAVRF